MESNYTALCSDCVLVCCGKCRLRAKEMAELNIALAAEIRNLNQQVERLERELAAKPESVLVRQLPVS